MKRKYTIEIDFEYFDIKEANENIEAMLEDMFDVMEDQGCSEIEYSVCLVVDLKEKVV